MIPLASSPLSVTVMAKVLDEYVERKVVAWLSLPGGMVGEHAVAWWADLGDEVNRKREIMRAADIKLLRASPWISTSVVGSVR